MIYHCTCGHKFGTIPLLMEHITHTINPMFPHERLFTRSEVVAEVMREREACVKEIEWEQRKSDLIRMRRTAIGVIQARGPVVLASEGGDAKHEPVSLGTGTDVAGAGAEAGGAAVLHSVATPAAEPAPASSPFPWWPETILKSVHVECFYYKGGEDRGIDYNCGTVDQAVVWLKSFQKSLDPVSGTRREGNDPKGTPAGDLRSGTTPLGNIEQQPSAYPAQAAEPTERPVPPSGQKTLPGPGMMLCPYCEGKGYEETVRFETAEAAIAWLKGGTDEHRAEILTDAARNLREWAEEILEKQDTAALRTPMMLGSQSGRVGAIRECAERIEAMAKEAGE
jgi:hypothetical protein